MRVLLLLLCDVSLQSVTGLGCGESLIVGDLVLVLPELGRQGVNYLDDGVVGHGLQAVPVLLELLEFEDLDERLLFGE